ncbi:MAG: bifunctional oligoribonuclease/PAP phosphatase NrnA [Proteobacteria bacterium]|nr:bifunctional oligoribonuclease/PAP phosphatase NrnA [Pseudomonadota bacterium]
MIVDLKDITEIKKTIDSCNSFIVASHIDPEGDAIGSSLAIYFALRDLGKKVCVYNESPLPKILNFLPGSDKIVSEIYSPDEYDCIFIVDCGDIDRIGKLSRRLEKLKIINIDHHSTNTTFGHINIVNRQASATGEVIFNFFNQLGFTITKEIAVNLYTAILVDTGSFRYSSTSSESFEICSKLMKYGVEPWEVSKNIYESYPFERMKLLALVLDTLEVFINGKVAFMYVTKEMFKKAGASEDLTEGFVNFGRAVEGVEISVLCKEVEENVYKLSLRSKGLIDVAQLAIKLGGGGHRNAAGCKVRGSFYDVKEKVMNALKEFEAQIF